MRSPMLPLSLASLALPAAVVLTATAVLACSSEAAGPTPVDTMPPDPPVDSIVLVDEFHLNSHTLEGTYGPLATKLAAEGFTVRRSGKAFTAEHLATARVLITSNALHVSNRDVWTLPTPSAFKAEEVSVVRTWVENGGALLLVADHMPFPGAASQLAGAFGVEMSNGFAYDTAQIRLPESCLLPHQVHVFRRSDGSLAEHPITNGRSAAERVDSVATFTGQAFDPDGALEPLMVFNERSISIEPETAWEFAADTAIVPVGGWLQGGALVLGEGRIVVLGEAAMFTEQTCWRSEQHPMGWQVPVAGQNAQFLLNVVRWLTEGL